MQRLLSDYALAIVDRDDAEVGRLAHEIRKLIALTVLPAEEPKH